MVAAMPFIRDDSNDKQFVDHWNNAKASARHVLLTEAGRNPHYKHRAWAFLPHDIRVDVVTIIKRLVPKAPAELNTTPNQTVTKYWWQDKEPENV